MFAASDKPRKHVTKQHVTSGFLVKSALISLLKYYTMYVNDAYEIKINLKMFLRTS